MLLNEGFGVIRRTPRQFRSRHSGMVRRTRPGISRFRVRLCEPPRNDIENYSPTIFSSNAISASGAVTFAEWLASIS
jgi:hypothetical protein